jgi:hypothetical protein|nr:MAG TPA: hypothetical protein [Caudoviricetes sp.]
MEDKKISEKIEINGKVYKKIELKGRKLFEFMQLARGKNIDRSVYFRNIEVKKFRDPIIKLAEKSRKNKKCNGKDFEWIIENIPVYRDEFVSIMVSYMELLTTEINKILIESDYDDLVEVISVGFQMEKEVVEEFTEDNFMTALAIINDAFPSA